MDNKVKLFLVVSLILCFLVFLYLRRKRLQENFECAKIDNSLFCIKDKSKIDRFRVDMDPFYKPKVQDMDFFNYIDFNADNDYIQSGNQTNYKKNYIVTDSFKELINNKQFGGQRLSVLNLLKDKINNIRFKYDYIHLDNPEIPSDDLRYGADRKNATRIITPGGVLFDKFNDDIIVFDAYRIRRFSYRDLKVKDSNSISDSKVMDYYPVLDSYPFEIHTQDDLYRKELCEIVYGVKSAVDSTPPNFIQDIDYSKANNIIIPNAEIETNIKQLRIDLLGEDFKDEEYTLIYKQKGDSEIKFTTKTFLERVDFLEKSLSRSKKFTKCLEDLKNDDKKCSIKYQKDLPSFDMGPIEGTGVEGMQYDDDKPPTIIHSTYIDNRMEPWSNSWNNFESEGIFSPLVSDNSKRMQIYNKGGNMVYKNFKDETNLSKKSGTITGPKQQSIVADKVQIFNKTSVSPLARDNSGDFLDEMLKEKSEGKINFHIETFQNKKAYKELSKQPSDKNKINYGYPSIELNRDDNFKLRFSIGVYNLPDELDCTGIGMEIVDTGEAQIILVPDTNNNRIQVFRKDKSELIFYGQFGNLPLTSRRSLPMYDKNHTRYEPIHDTENYNSLPGCKKTCDFDTENNYKGTRDKDFMNRKCMPWGDYLNEEVKINKQQINQEYKRENFKEKDFLKSVRDEIKKGGNLGNRCQSLDNGKPVCIVDGDGISILSKCFPDFYLNEVEGETKATKTEEVKDMDTCTSWMDDYTSRFGPIDANLCLGDNQALPLTPKEIKEGKKPTKDCVFECDTKYSYRRANIHQRQTVFKEVQGEESEIYRKRGHFYSLLDEYHRCKDGIDYEKKKNKKAFDDSEFINPHFLGVDSQACIGKKSTDGDCKTKDTRNTSGVDNCSLGYRKYLLKVMAATNQGQKFGQLFHPKSIAYDDIDKKYYVVDGYHHSIQCFNLEEEKEVTESGEKLKFVSADAQYNNENVFYYDENFRTGDALKYNSTPIYSLGLRQNLLFEKDFNAFSRKGIVSDETSEYIDSLEKYKKMAKENIEKH